MPKLNNITREKLKEIFDNVKSGCSTAMACKKAGIPHQTFRDNFDDEDFRKILYESQLTQMEAIEAEIEELANAPYVEEGKNRAVEWQERRLKIDTLKWRLGRCTSRCGVKKYAGTIDTKVKAIDESLAKNEVEIDTAIKYSELLKNQAAALVASGFEKKFEDALIVIKSLLEQSKSVLKKEEQS